MDGARLGRGIMGMDGSRQPGMGRSPQGLMTIDTMNRVAKCRRSRFHVMKHSEQPERYKFSPSMTNFGNNSFKFLCSVKSEVRYWPTLSVFESETATCMATSD